MKNKPFKYFQLKSNCCNESIEFYKTENVGYIKCTKCEEQCDIIGPKTKSEKFQFEIKKRINSLDYYEKNKKQNAINFEKTILIEEIFETWKNIYFLKK